MISWVLRDPVLYHLQVQMGPGAPAGAAALGDDLSGGHGLPFGHQNFRAVGVHGHQPAAVVDGHMIPVAGLLVADE